ncbi:glutathione S-transferase 1-like [Drosophila nasuta]|uniref:Glutathione S-transferase 1-like n=1 Tax=Drosophila albomicans TaxID=7291 RepID=A0A6P8Y3G8_DROAB|nr:glutathione S-transferase 1-like [Drosophila albomicans]XP_060654264.1 glutathione S-transferase 1-like [Drosophila nasuta]
MGKIILYGFDISPPSRAVKLTLAALQLPYEYVIVNTFKKEQNSPEYLKKNPQHTVPTLEDDGRYISDSHAILAYLAKKYGKDSSLYPSDVFQSAIVDQRLHYDSSTLFTSIWFGITKPLVLAGKTQIEKAKIAELVEAYDLLETFLASNNYITGPDLTIADFSIITTISALMILLVPDSSKYPKLNAWLKRIQELPYYQEATGSGADELETVLKSTNFTIES